MAGQWDVLSVSQVSEERQERVSLSFRGTQCHGHSRSRTWGSTCVLGGFSGRTEEGKMRGREVVCVLSRAPSVLSDVTGTLAQRARPEPVRAPAASPPPRALAARSL